MTFLEQPWVVGLALGSCMATAIASLGQAVLAQTPSPPPAKSPGETRGPQTEDSTEAPDETASRFACQMHNGQYTVMYVPSSQPGQMYPWAIPQDMGSAWPAQRRCQEISARLESYRPDGLLTLSTGVENGYNIVCVTTEAVPTCRIVFTVPPGQDPALTRDQVFNNLASADQGQPTAGVNTFVPSRSGSLGSIDDLLRLPSTPSARRNGSRSGIDLKPFLVPADGGTGTALSDDRAVSPGRPLNPDQFR